LASGGELKFGVRIYFSISFPDRLGYLIGNPSSGYRSDKPRKTLGISELSVLDSVDGNEEDIVNMIVQILLSELPGNEQPDASTESRVQLLDRLRLFSVDPVYKLYPVRILILEGRRHGLGGQQDSSWLKRKKRELGRLGSRGIGFS
jgi:hypothetical protein